ncbi:MAG: FtsH protease activity modulator HflK [Myxococcota bacterium]|nr:FtsH protease activity modulator HflK [Myxococcota bacterium]
MARDDDEDLDSDDSIRRSVGRTLVNWLTSLVSLAVIVGWAATGIYQLSPGESAVVLFLGERDRTVVDEGLHWRYPPPIETIEIVNVSEVRQESFGLAPARPSTPRDSAPADDDTPAAGETSASFENAMQTADNNIVNLGYVLKYEIDDAFAYLYGMNDPEQTLLDATRSAVREVVGQMSVDDVLYTRRQQIEVRARELLNERLAEYFGEMQVESAFRIRGVELQVVQPPAQVQEAFDEIIAAGQDEERAIFLAKGDAKEMLEKAAGQAIELEQSSLAYRDAKVLEARGKAARFEALLAEYKLAPEVTRRRLYLETMEEILPEVDKMVIEPGAASVVPFLPAGRAQGMPLVLPQPSAGGKR